MLPGVSIHRGEKPQVKGSDQPQSTLSRIRYHAWTQKASLIVITFLGTFFSSALIATMARSQPFLRRNAPVVIGA